MESKPKEATISIGEFSKRKNKFSYYFLNNEVGEKYREGIIFQRCLNRSPVEFKKISDELVSRSDHQGFPYLKLLYQAYQIMYPLVRTHEDLFDIDI